MELNSTIVIGVTGFSAIVLLSFAHTKAEEKKEKNKNKKTSDTSEVSCPGGTVSAALELNNKRTQ